ncbi:uncharacterized protein LOC136041911 isoform X2 [Artemia franciscana]|uniref:uncharacterized protein LOC136041911 isoform X2 n=1 Tax=Artemia franciscana TaxID=6661 RepID=UPI0032DA303C
MDQDSVRSTQQLLPESVSEGFPLMEGDTEEIPRSEPFRPPAAFEEPEERLEKLLGGFENKSDRHNGNNSRNSKEFQKRELINPGPVSAIDKRNAIANSLYEEEEEMEAQRQSPVKKTFGKSVRISLPLPSPKKYPPTAPKISSQNNQPRKPALQAIINDLRKEIEKENDTSKIDVLPGPTTGRPTVYPVKRKVPGETEKVSPVSQPPALKRSRPYTTTYPTKSGQKPEFLQMRQHKQLISEVMREMSQSGMHTDTTMIAGGQKINVHRLVLAACSPFLKAVLAEQQGDATIIIPDTPYEDLAMLIDYIYCGESVVPEDRLNVILHLMSLLGFTPPVYTIRKSKAPVRSFARPTPRPVSAVQEGRIGGRGQSTTPLAPSGLKPVGQARPLQKGPGMKAHFEDPLTTAVRQIEDFNFVPDRKVGGCWLRQITNQEAVQPRKRAVGRKIDVKSEKPQKLVIKLKEPFDRNKPRKVVIQRLDEEGGKTDDVNAALALTSLGGQQQQDQVMGELDAYQETSYQEGTYPESMLNSLLNTDHQGGGMSMPSLDPDPLPEEKMHKAEEYQQQEGAYMLEDGTIIPGGSIEGLPITTEGADGTTYILVMDENQENLDLNQVIQGLSGNGEGNQAVLRIEEDGTVSYAPTEDQADGGNIYGSADDTGLAYTGMPEEGFDGQTFEGQEYQEGYDLEVKPKI